MRVKTSLDKTQFFYMSHGTHDQWLSTIRQTKTSTLSKSGFACSEHSLSFPPWFNAAGMFSVVRALQQEETVGWRLFQTPLVFLPQRLPICVRVNAISLWAVSCLGEKKKAFSSSPTPVSCLVIMKFIQHGTLAHCCEAFQSNLNRNSWRRQTPQRLNLDIQIKASLVVGLVSYKIIKAAFVRISH